MEHIFHKIRNDNLDDALSNGDINRILKKLDEKTKIIRYPELARYKNVEQLLGVHKSVVILLLAKEKDEFNPNYGHWVLLFKYPKKQNGKEVLEYFDPYGISVDVEKQEFPYLSKLLLDYINKGGKIVYNHHRFQKLEPGINTCGKHVINRLAFKNLILDKYIYMFKDIDKNITSDNIVDFLTRE